MTAIIEIEGNLVRHIDRRIVSQTTLPEMLAQLERRPPVQLPILPRNRVIGLNWDQSDGDTSLTLALVLPPSLRLLPLRHDVLVPGLDPEVALPWTVFVFEMTAAGLNPLLGENWAFNAVRFYFTRNEPDGPDIELIPATLPNVYTGATICWGTTGVNARQPLHDRIDETINTFYQTEFNHAGDIDNNWPYRTRDYSRWARETIAHGRTAYRLWSDWDDRPKTTLSEALHMKTNIRTPLVLPDAIPVIPVNPTFGRAEEWFRGLQPVQRLRLATVVKQLETEAPTLFVAPDQLDTDLGA